MTLKDIKRKVLVLIEEYSEEEKALTSDVDIDTKFNDIAYARLLEISAIKKIPKYVEMSVKEGDTITFDDLERECGYSVYQVGNISGIDYLLKEGGKRIKVLSSGMAEIDLYVYPEEITDKTGNSYEIELPQDAATCLVYGIAADILLTDVSMGYGDMFRNEYEKMLQRLGTSYQAPSVELSGGVEI